MSSVSLEDVMENENISMAISKVIKNSGCCGIDKMSTKELPEFWYKYGKDIKNNILCGRYIPQPVMRIYISKEGTKKKRMLSIPTVLDRMIQQAIMQVLSAVYENEFHDNSYGYRKGRGTINALRNCLDCLNRGYVYIADIDIEGFFDNVDHRLLLDILEKKNIDKKLLTLIQRYLENKVMYGGKIYTVKKGVSQGSPLSPLLANIVLNELDKFISGFTYEFTRYADDVIVMCKSAVAAEESMKLVSEFLNLNLGLNLNKEKSKIVTADELEYMGYSFKKANKGKYVLSINDSTVAKANSRMFKYINRLNDDVDEWWNKLGSFNRGWVNYYKYADNVVLEEVIKELDTKFNKHVADKLDSYCEEKDISKEDIIFSIFDSNQFVSCMEWFRHLEKEMDGEYNGCI